MTKTVIKTVLIAATILYSSDTLAASVKSNGDEYEVVEYHSLITNKGLTGKWKPDQPSVFNGQKIVTTGYVAYGCDFDQYTNNRGHLDPQLLRPIDLSEVGLLDNFVMVYWGKINASQWNRFKTECKRFTTRMDLSDPKAEPAVVLFGTFHNGDGITKSCMTKSNSFIDENIKNCSHIEAENIIFADSVKSGYKDTIDFGAKLVSEIGPLVLKLLPKH